jgi:hypothetical protein
MLLLGLSLWLTAAQIATRAAVLDHAMCFLHSHQLERKLVSEGVVEPKSVNVGEHSF